MKLRTRLFVSSSIPLAVIGFLIGLAYVEFDRNVVPDLLGHLAEKAQTTTARLASQLDVGLGADDPAMIEEAVRNTIGNDADLAFVEVRDADGRKVYEIGSVAPSATGAEHRAAFAAGRAVAWSSISLEGLALGTVQVAYSTARVDQLVRWSKVIGAVLLALWLAALLYAWWFARSFVAPIRQMMDFAGTVARGELREQLAARAPGELDDLRQDLNAMTRELAAREDQRARAAARAEAMQQELLTVTRLAGMAEVATGVLHNVGNVLNSLNTSVSVVHDRLRATKLPALARSVELLKSSPDGPAGFLATERGKVLPQFLDKVSAQLAADHAMTMTELQSITRNVDHIKAIVATQQSYTRVGAVLEPTDLAALVDDALAMTEASCARHEIELVRDYQPLAPVVTDRHRVLQILVNLISNSRHAVKEMPPDRRRIRVHLRDTGGSAAITVEDTGVGIAEEHLTSVFQHGFTTRKDGHGFGLHASANAASELGGRLTGTSDGVGKGASFTVALPRTGRGDHDVN
jgi:signal transduction histidine kinase